MEILESITEQIGSVGLPLAAVTVTALPQPQTPVLLMLHWHGFRTEPPVPPKRQRPVPASALQLNAGWQRVAELDRAVLDAAWQLGAWEMERRDRRRCDAPGTPEREAVECRQAFGDNPLHPGDESHLEAAAPDRIDMMRFAARRGYLRWLFRPVHGGLWRELADDDSLAADGRRSPPCPVMPQDYAGARGAPSVVRLGRRSRLVVVRLPPPGD